MYAHTMGASFCDLRGKFPVLFTYLQREMSWRLNETLFFNIEDPLVINHNRMQDFIDFASPSYIT